MARTDPILQLTDAKAESSVLGAILINPGCMVDVAEAVEPGDFHDEPRSWVYEAMLSLWHEGTRIDFVTLCRRLEERGKLQQVGGQARLAQLINETPTGLGARDYASIVRRLATLRRLLSAAGLIARLAYDSKDAAVEDVFARARALVDAVAPGDGDDAVLLWLDSLEMFFTVQTQRIEELAAIGSGTALARVDFPWKALRQFISYLRPGMLAMVVADSSVGKTSFMECCAEYWARQGLQVTFFHLELPHQFMIDRRMCRQSGVPMRVVESGTVTAAMEDANGAMSLWHGGIHYVHCPGWTAQRIATQMRLLHSKGLCDVAVVDYMQKMRLLRERGQNDAAAIGDQAEVIKTALEQLGIPAILGSQVNRASLAFERKTAQAVRGSGEPGEKSNVVITLDREILNQDATDPAGNVIAHAGDRSPTVRGRVDKNTGGPTGDFQLKMNAARFLILDVSGATPGVSVMGEPVVMEHEPLELQF